ncbi:MAG: hypothetical protein IPK07_23905 [Deltaproteobacteria bacterium]|nr:hypothetical protein [Deltaproteobacteria bacterium]
MRITIRTKLLGLGLGGLAFTLGPRVGSVRGAEEADRPATSRAVTLGERVPRAAPSNQLGAARPASLRATFADS